MNAELHIAAALRGNITYLERAYGTRPFKVANITENKKEATLHLMLMNSSPGILDGDEYNIKIELAPHTSLQLNSQSYQRLFAMKNGAAQTTEVHLGEGSSFCFIPHPSVPHESSVFTAVNKIFLADDCTLVWGEVLTCGRKLNGEIFKFTRYHNLTEIFINDKLVIRENIMVDPAMIDMNAIGQLEGYTHQATLIYLNDRDTDDTLATRISDYLGLQTEIMFGISEAPAKGLIVRLLGQKAEPLFDCLRKIGYQLINPALKKAENAS